MKKILSMALATLMVAGVVSGCSKPTETPPTTDTPKEEVLKVAAFKGGYGEDLWKNLAAKFEETHEGVKVELTVSAKIDEEVRPQMLAGNFPDVVFYSIGQPSGFTETMIKEDMLLDISDVFADAAVSSVIADGFADNAITQPYGDGKTYLAPLFYSPCGLWYNKANFAEGKYTLPTTWDEMWALGDTAAADGISLFNYPTNGYFDGFMYALMNQAGGDEYYGKALKYDAETWNSEAGTKVLETVGTLVSKYTAKDAAANANGGNFLMNQQAVLDNKSLFMPNGNWIIGEMANAPRAEGFEWGFMALPAFEANGPRYSYTFFEQMMVPKDAANPELAKEFVKFMYSDAAVEIMLNNTVTNDNGESVPATVVQPVKGIVEKLSGDNKVIYSIYEQENTFPALGTFNATEPVEGLTIADTLYAPIDSLLEGNVTVEDWKGSLNNAFEQFRAALK